MEKNKKKTAFFVVLLFIVAIVWGSGFIASQMALDAGITPQLLMAVRFSLAAVIIGLTFFKKIKLNLKIKDICPGVIVGFFLFMGFIIQIVALQYTTPANNAFLTSTNVIMVPFIWWIVNKKSPKLRIFVASFLCVIGVAVLSYKAGQGISFAVGDILTLVCALFFALQIVTTETLAKKMETSVIVFLQFVTAAILSLGVFLVTDRDFTPLMNLDGLLPVVYLAVFSTCLCYFLQTFAQKYVSSSKAAIIMATEALFGSMFSVILGYDALTTYMLVGGGIIMLALILSEWKMGNS